MKSDSLPNFPSLTPDDRVWRLDWFGECAYPGTVRRYAQPSIKVVLSPLRCDPADHTALLLPDCTDFQHQHSAWAPIAALPMLAIGDLWQAGRQIASPDYRVEAFKGLAINPESTAFVKAGLALEEHFLLPLSHHPWHRHHTQSYCVAVSLGDQRRLLVPCVEIIRFYFGSSSNFLQRLFTAPLSQESFWTHKHFNPATRHLHLALANHLSGLSAPDIGRIAESKFAWRAAAGIYASCQKATATGHPAYPYTGFPFEGITDLVASGLWLPFGDQENATFLAYRLRSCSHPFPFFSLSYEAGDRKARYGTAENSGAGGKTFSRSSPRGQKSEAAETDPGANRAQRMGVLTVQHRFPDLHRKQIWREKIEAMPQADVYLRHTNGSLEQVAFGESEGHSATSAIDGVQSTYGDTEPTDATLPWFVRAGLKQIAANPAYASANRIIKVVAPIGITRPVFSLPVVIDQDGVIDTTLLFTRADGSTRQRRGCFVEVTDSDQKQCYLAVLEGSMQKASPTIYPAGKAELPSILRLFGYHAPRGNDDTVCDNH
ncbi:MAG: hypothetical protein KGN39_10915 [Betaproteobacteria bacterium]|nr:hypothetical protein [Betaproteobacteria bacterium]